LFYFSFISECGSGFNAETIQKTDVKPCKRVEILFEKPGLPDCSVCRYAHRSPHSTWRHLLNPNQTSMLASDKQTNDIIA